MKSLPPVAETTASPYLKDPEVQLMLRVKGGDDAAFGQLVSRYQDRLVTILANLLHGDRSTAEDLAQEAFLRIYRARKGYTPDAKFSTWVFRIVHNLASNARRSSGRRKEVQLKGEKSGPLAGQAHDKILADKSAQMPTRQLDKSELRGKVLEAMEELNERQRIALLLHKFEGMSYAEIAEAMESSQEAIKSLLSRARDALRTSLEAYIT